MKLFFAVLIVYSFFVSCNNPSIPVPPEKNGAFSVYFLKDTTLRIGDIINAKLDSLQLADTPWLTQDDIEFYDWSSHCIYLKKDRNALFPDYMLDNAGISFNFSYVNRPLVFTADGKKCYAACLTSAVTSARWPCPDINDLYFGLYPPDIIYIEGFLNQGVDTRNNKEITSALTESKKLHKGIWVSMAILQLDNADTAVIHYRITITNIDKDNLYVLDPDKTGPELFHYFTNGPYLYNLTNNTYYWSDYKKTTAPQPDNYYDSNWFTKIESGGSITRNIVLKGYHNLPDGEYTGNFVFSNPTNINKTDRTLIDGRYWIGNTNSGTFPFIIRDGKIIAVIEKE